MKLFLVISRLCLVTAFVLMGGCVSSISGSGRGLAPAPENLEPADFTAPVRPEYLPTRAVGGNPPENGLRYWHKPLYRVPLHSCFPSIIHRKTEAGDILELWENTWGETAADRGITVSRGAAFADFRNEQEITVCTGEIIDDVYIPGVEIPEAADKSAHLAPGRGFTRPHVVYDPEFGYVALVCVTPDYKSFLSPAVLSSPDGKPGNWTYHGMLSGDPELRPGRGWSDGGTILRMADGSWRIYLNGFGGVAVAMLSSDSFAGPWKFMRDESGRIQDMLPLDPQGRSVRNCFPHVLRVSDSEWHLWYSDQWPVHSVWHMQSRDGLHWEPYGEQPEITRAMAGGRPVKCIRTFLAPDTGTIFGLISFWRSMPERNGYGWQLYLMRLPTGLKQPQ